MKDMNIAKLTSDDLPLFNGITRDLFPMIELPVIDYEVIYKVMREVMAYENIQVIGFDFHIRFVFILRYLLSVGWQN